MQKKRATDREGWRERKIDREQVKGREYFFIVPVRQRGDETAAGRGFDPDHWSGAQLMTLELIRPPRINSSGSQTGCRYTLRGHGGTGGGSRAKGTLQKKTKSTAIRVP